MMVMMMRVTPIFGVGEAKPGNLVLFCEKHFLFLLVLLRDSPPASTAPCVYCHSIINHRCTGTPWVCLVRRRRNGNGGAFL